VLVVNDADLIGRGNGRACYVHPDKPDLCLKVALNARGAKESRRESFYLKRLAHFYGDDVYTHVSRLFETVMTSHGQALAAERILDGSTGQTSPLLRDALTRETLEECRGEWEQALDEFNAGLQSSAIVFRDWSSTNLCVKRLASGRRRFVLIDGFAPKEVLLRWFPSRRHARLRNRHYIERAGIDSIDAILELCERERAYPDAHIASVLPD